MVELMQTSYIKRNKTKKNCECGSSIIWLLQIWLEVSFILHYSYISGSVMGIGPPDGWLPVDISCPVSQVEDEEEHRKDDAWNFVHFADSVVGLLHPFADVLAIHPGKPNLSDWLGRGRGWGCAGSAFSDGSQSRFFSNTHWVSSAHNVKCVVSLFGEGRRLASLWEKKSAETDCYKWR